MLNKSRMPFALALEKIKNDTKFENFMIWGLEFGTINLNKYLNYAFKK